MLYMNDGILWFCRCLIYGQVYFPLHHHLGELGRVKVLDFSVACDLTMAQHRYPAAQLHDLVQFMGNKDDAVALIPQLLELNEQLPCLLRRQNGGRFVQDQNLHASDQALQQLDLLLLSYGKVPDQLVRLHVQVELVHRLLGDPDGLLLIEDRSLSGLHAQDNVLRHRQVGYLHKMLMHHADTLCNSVQRIGNVCFFPIDIDFAFLMRFQSKQDLHQCRFTGTVFSDQGMDLAFIHG